MVFIWMLAIASIWVHTSSKSDVAQYWFRFDPVQTPAIILACVSALLAAVFPSRAIVVVFFAIVQVGVIYTRMPYIPTHVVMELILFSSMIFAFVCLAAKQRSLKVDSQEYFEIYAPVARWLLITMYFFGTFHKLNPGFLSIETSCAIPFIHGMPFLPQAIREHELVGYAGIYGTLIMEGIAMCLLLSKRTKYYGMLLGMPFHFFIGISEAGTLAHFSAFAIALHSSFLPTSFAERLKARFHRATSFKARKHHAGSDTYSDFTSVCVCANKYHDVDECGVR